MDQVEIDLDWANRPDKVCSKVERLYADKVGDERIEFDLKGSESIEKHSKNEACKN
jgi:hypothetical protein